MISIEIMKTTDEKEMQKTTKEKQRQKGARETEAIAKRWELNDKNMRLVIRFDMLLNPSFKMTKSFANIARNTASTSKFIY